MLVILLMYMPSAVELIQRKAALENSLEQVQEKQQQLYDNFMQDKEILDSSLANFDAGFTYKPSNILAFCWEHAKRCCCTTEEQLHEMAARALHREHAEELKNLSEKYFRKLEALFDEEQSLIEAIKSIEAECHTEPHIQKNSHALLLSTSLSKKSALRVLSNPSAV
jgi:hypothetical protein